MYVFSGILNSNCLDTKEILVSIVAYARDYFFFFVSIFTNTILSRNLEQCYIYPCYHHDKRQGVADPVYSRYYEQCRILKKSLAF